MWLEEQVAKTPKEAGSTLKIEWCVALQRLLLPRLLRAYSCSTLPPSLFEYITNVSEKGPIDVCVCLFAQTREGLCSQAQPRFTPSWWERVFFIEFVSITASLVFPKRSDFNFYWLVLTKCSHIRWTRSSWNIWIETFWSCDQLGIEGCWVTSTQGRMSSGRLQFIMYFISHIKLLRFARRPRQLDPIPNMQKQSYENLSELLRVCVLCVWTGPSKAVCVCVVCAQTNWYSS